MKFLLAFTLIAVVSATDDGFLDKETYLADVAPKVLESIQDFRGGYGKMTTDQRGFLKHFETVVGDFDKEKIAKLTAGCAQVFGKEQCKKILGRSDAATSDNPLSEIASRGVPCSCSYLSDFCDTDSQYCLRGAYECGFHGGCGVAWAYQCNGICVPYDCVECE